MGMGRSMTTGVFVREFPLSTVPEGDKEAGEWLMELWKSKDDIKAAYLAEDWDRLAELGEFAARYPGRRVWSLVWSVSTNLLVLVPLFVILMQGGMVTWIVALAVLGLAWLALDSMVR